MKPVEQLRRRDPVVFRFAGGKEDAQKIIEVVRSFGDEAIHNEKEDYGTHGRGEHIIIRFGEDRKKEVMLWSGGFPVVYENATYLYYDTEDFKRTFTPMEGAYAQVMEAYESSVIDFEELNAVAVPNLLKKPTEITSQDYVSRVYTLKAVQFPEKSPNEASKDLEERIRAVGAFVFEHDGVVDSFSQTELFFTHKEATFFAWPGSWVTFDTNGDAAVWSESSFRHSWQHASEA